MNNTHYLDPVQRWAESAWRKLNLKPAADLHAVADYLKIRVIRRGFATSQAAGVYWMTPKGQAVIVINKYIEVVERQRFTLAHEIGHHLLRKPGETGRLCVLGLPSFQSNPVTERQCNQFATALLMPERLVREWWNDLASNPTGRVPVMANRFGVSRSALRVRLEGLQLQKNKFSARSQPVSY